MLRTLGQLLIGQLVYNTYYQVNRVEILLGFVHFLVLLQLLILGETSAPSANYNLVVGSIS